MMIFSTGAVAAMLNLAPGSWLVISDDVMGGESTGRAVATEQGMRFSGELSLANNGGFSSTRRLVNEAPEWAVGVLLKVRGDGRRYQARLRQDHRFDGISWRHEFTTNGDWQEIRLRFADFEPVFRGNPVNGAGALDPARIHQLGFLVADKQAGPFELEVGHIEFYAEP